MSYRDAVEGLIELPEAKASGWLAVVDELHTVSARQLRQLALESPLKAPGIVVPKSARAFDVKAARRYFSDGWVPVEVPVEELRAVMPSGVVSRRAWRVGISPLIVEVFEGGLGGQACVGRRRRPLGSRRGRGGKAFGDCFRRTEDPRMPLRRVR